MGDRLTDTTEKAEVNKYKLTLEQEAYILIKNYRQKIGAVFHSYENVSIKMENTLESFLKEYKALCQAHQS